MQKAKEVDVMLAMTVKQFVEGTFRRYGMSEEDVKECIEHVVERLNSVEEFFEMKNNKGEFVMSIDFWNTDIGDYPLKEHGRLRYAVDGYAIKWCVKKINSMK